MTWLASWFYGLWAYVKGKGRSDFWALLGFANLIGLIIILMLEDHEPES